MASEKGDAPLSRRPVYGTAAGGITPEIYRNDLLRAEIYPDSDDTTTLGDGDDGVCDRVELKYNRQGELIEKKDQTERSTGSHTMRWAA